MANASIAGLAALLAVVALLAGPAGAAPSVILKGRYTGTADAAGLSFRLAPDPGGFRGTWRGPSGAQDLLADRVGDIAEAVIDWQGRAALLRIAPQPYGAEAVLIPFLPDGRLETGAGRVLPFLAEGVSSTTLPRGHAFAPTRAGEGRITGTAFLRSYRWWWPKGVALGYRALSEDHRTLIRLFPAVQLDLIWKLCLAPGADRAQGMALRGAGVGCADVTTAMAAVQRDGGYPAYRAAVEDERAPLIEAMRCAQLEVMPEGACARAAERVAQAAVSLDTPARLLDRLR